MSRPFSLTLTVIATIVFAPLALPVHAQTCEQELARQDAALRQFETDARRESVGFLLEDARRGALGEAAKRLRGDPTADAARDIKARLDEYQAYVDQGRTFQAVAAELSQCLRGGTTNCLAQIKEGVQRHLEASRLAARISEAVQKWIDSLGNETISRAIDRVDRTRSILENFTKRAAGTATQAATQGIASCLNDFDRRVQQAQNTSTPVDPRQPPAGTAPPRGGMSGLTKTALVVIPVGLGLGLWANSVIEDATSTAGGNNGGGGVSTGPPAQIRLVSATAIQCTRVGGASLQSLCEGLVVLDVANIFSQGAQVCIRTQPDGLPACTPKGASSEIRFQIQERIINVDANGNITNCRQTQTGIAVFPGTPSGTPTAVVSASIPMSCR